MVCRVIKNINTPLIFDNLKCGDIFIEQKETTPYMKIEEVENEYESYNAICLMDGTEERFDPFDRVFKYNRDIVLNAEDFVGEEGEG